MLTPASGITVRKAPGHAEFNFGQIVKLPYTEGWNDEQIFPLTSRIFASSIAAQDYETPYLPMGYHLKLRFFTTWGDQHYIGMNGIEVFDQLGQPLLLSVRHKVWANPSSVSDTDIRTPDKVVDGVN